MSEPLSALADRAWDAVVVGAGPAGTATATLLARQGLAVLLLDKAAFPRPKVCGGCLNRAALTALDAAGLGDGIRRLGAPPLTRLRLHSGRRRATVPLREGAGVSRRALDSALVGVARQAGAVFADDARAHAERPAGGMRPLRLTRGGEQIRVHARVVVVASGLGPLPADDATALPAIPVPGARIGAGTIAPEALPEVAPGEIVMVHGKGGYVGLARVEGGQLNVAAAFAPEFLRAVGGAGEAAAALVEGAGLPLAPLLRSLRWRGTPPLTFRRQGLALEQLFVLGDAGGYVEPFTGEGMAWALAGALALAPVAAAAIERWDDHLAHRWERLHRTVVGRRQRLCRVVAATLRRPALTAAVVTLLRAAPRLAAPAVAAINAPPKPFRRALGGLPC
mgnify:CR=1 FL=1